MSSFIFNPIILKDDLEWDFQTTNVSWEVLSSDGGNPCILTTTRNNTIQTGDKILITNHSGSDGIDATDGNFTATRISANQFSIPIDGINPGTGGQVAGTLDGTSYTNISCDLRTSHTTSSDGTPATLLIALTFAWITQGIFKYSFTASAANIITALGGSDKACVSLYWTNPSGKIETFIIGDVQIISR